MKTLQNGDYCILNKEFQLRELEKIEGTEFALTFFNDGYDAISFYDQMLITDVDTRLTLLSFEDFKERAINTFKK